MNSTQTAKWAPKACCLGLSGPVLYTPAVRYVLITVLLPLALNHRPSLASFRDSSLWPGSSFCASLLCAGHRLHERSSLHGVTQPPLLRLRSLISWALLGNSPSRAAHVTE